MRISEMYKKKFSRSRRDIMLHKYKILFDENQLSLEDYRRYLKRLLKFHCFEQFDIVINRYIELLKINNLLELDQNDKFIAGLKLSYYLKKENATKAAEYVTFLAKEGTIDFGNPTWEDLDAMLQISLYQIEVGLLDIVEELLYPVFEEIRKRENSSFDYKLLGIESFGVMAKYKYAINNIEKAEECERIAYLGDLAFSQGLK